MEKLNVMIYLIQVVFVLILFVYLSTLTIIQAIEQL